MIGQGIPNKKIAGHAPPCGWNADERGGAVRTMANRTIAKLGARIDALALPDIGSGRWGRAHNRIIGHPPHRSMIVCEPWGFCFKAAKEGIVDTRKRFELRISDEDRQRLRALAEQQATTESDPIRALIRGAHDRVGNDSKTGKEERTAA